MSNLAPIRQRFAMAAIGLGIIILALLGYLLWPNTGEPNEQALKQQYESLSREVTRISDPAQTRADLKTLYAEDVPDRYSTISEELEKLFKETGVTPQPITYAPEPDTKGGLPDVQQVKVETNVTGDYLKVARFINALEQSKLLFIINKIALSSQEGGKVSLQITFDTFVRQAE